MIRYIALYGVYVAVLHIFEGPWRRWKEGREGKALDWWTAQHVIWGAIAHRMGVSRGEIMVLTTANEAAELLIRKYRPDLLWGSPESLVNVVVDLMATWVGHRISEATT